MNYSNLLLLALGGLGILIHNLMKMDGINRKNKGTFVFSAFMKLERFSIMLSACVIIVAVLAKTEISQFEKFSKWQGLFFVAIGYMAQSIIYHFKGKADKYLGDDKPQE